MRCALLQLIKETAQMLHLRTSSFVSCMHKLSTHHLHCHLTFKAARTAFHFEEKLLIHIPGPRCASAKENQFWEKCMVENNEVSRWTGLFIRFVLEFVFIRYLATNIHKWFLEDLHCCLLIDPSLHSTDTHNGVDNPILAHPVCVL